MHSDSPSVAQCQAACRLCWAACLSQAGAADLRQPGRAVRQTHEHHLHLGPQRGHHLLHHREWQHTSTSRVILIVSIQCLKKFTSYCINLTELYIRISLAISVTSVIKRGLKVALRAL